MLKELTADQLGTLLTLGAAAVGSLLVIVVNCIHGSKCKHIKCCGLECDRQITEDEEAPTDGTTVPIVPTNTELGST
tara:strand:- start:255 stop:485 length:231 start_codon:yes stop_codon:yes gene_type:complete